jgi:hypothetical protein
MTIEYTISGRPARDPPVVEGSTTRKYRNATTAPRRLPVALINRGVGAGFGGWAMR